MTRPSISASEPVYEARDILACGNGKLGKGGSVYGSVEVLQDKSPSCGISQITIRRSELLPVPALAPSLIPTLIWLLMMYLIRQAAYTLKSDPLYVNSTCTVLPCSTTYSSTYNYFLKLTNSSQLLSWCWFRLSLGFAIHVRYS
jgi:hypothetical protein